MNKPSALIIEDNSIMREALADTLEILGYETTTAFDGVDGVDKFERGSYDVVLTDLEMPRMTGREVERRIHARHPGVGVVVISAAEPSALDRLRRDRVAVLEKPVTLEELQDAIARVTARADVAAVA